jgi:hypothetical protein
MRPRLESWGRWKIVGSPGGADLIIRFTVKTKMAAFGWGGVDATLTIVDPKSGATLWQSKKQGASRNVAHAYASPEERASEGLMEQLRKASEAWPVE